MEYKRVVNKNGFESMMAQRLLIMLNFALQCVVSYHNVPRWVIAHKGIIKG